MKPRNRTNAHATGVSLVTSAWYSRPRRLRMRSYTATTHMAAVEGEHREQVEDPDDR